MNEQPELPMQVVPTHTFVVYDRQTGTVVHIHDFVSASDDSPWSADDMKRVALDEVRDRGQLDRLVAIEMPADLRRSGENFRVDVAAGRLVAEPSREAPLSRKTRVDKSARD
jgi:hypothetical protein